MEHSQISGGALTHLLVLARVSANKQFLDEKREWLMRDGNGDHIAAGEGPKEAI